MATLYENLKEKNAKYLNKDTLYSDYDFAGAQEALKAHYSFYNQNISLLNKAQRYGDQKTIGFAIGNLNDTAVFIKDLETVYSQKLDEQKAAQDAEAARLAQEEKLLQQQQAAKAAKAAEDAKKISLLGQKDLAGVAKTYGTTDLDAAAEIKRQRAENARKQEQSEKIESMSLRIARGQRGRRGVATGTGGGRGFFERYFQ